MESIDENLIISNNTNGITIGLNPTITNNIIFNVSNSASEPILELRDNGDILVKGKLIENDSEVVEAMRQLLYGTGHMSELKTEMNKSGLGGLI